jgi:hypothetical protein
MRVITKKAKQMNRMLLFSRIFAGIISIAAIIMVIFAVDPSIWRFQSFWYGMKFFIFLFEMLFLLIGYAIALLFGYGDTGAAAIMEAIHVALFGGNTTIMGIPVSELITQPTQLPTQQNLIDAIYAFFIMIAILIAIIASVGFLRECNTALSSTAFFALNIVLGLAALNDKLLLNLNFNSANIIQMVFSQMVITGFLMYFALELSFQAAYIYNVIGPNIERHRRISKHISRLKTYELPIDAEKGVNNYEGGTVKGADTSSSRFKVTTAFSRIKGLVGKKLFRVTADEDWDKLNLRLKNYYLTLEEDDPFVSLTLSASAYTPSIMRLVLIIIGSTLTRVLILVALSWVALNPIPILTALNFPPSVILSLEATQPEMILLVLVPLAISFLLIGLIIQWIQNIITRRMAKEETEGRIIHTIKEQQEEKEQEEASPST